MTQKFIQSLVLENYSEPPPPRTHTQKMLWLKITSISLNKLGIQPCAESKMEEKFISYVWFPPNQSLWLQ